MLTYSGCPEKLFVLSPNGKTFTRSIWAVKQVHKTCQEFIEENDSICAVVLLVGGRKVLWGLEELGGHLIFPGTKYGVTLIDEKFHPIRVDNVFSAYILPYWPKLPAKPTCPPFDGVKFWYPNLK